MSDRSASETNQPSRAVPLFRPEAMGDPEHGEAFAFAIPSWRLLSAAGAFAAFLLILFSLFANFDRTAQARGLVVPASGISRLVSPQAGMVSAVLARQDSPVKTGDPLFRIASASYLSTGEAASAQSLAAFRRQREMSLGGMEAEGSRAEAEAARVRQEVMQLQDSGRSIDEQIALQEERIAKNQERLQNLAPLREKGYVSDLTYQMQEETVLALRQELSSLHQRKTENRHRTSQTLLQLRELAAEARRSRLQTGAALMELDRGAMQAEVEAEVVISAPFDGIVTAVNVPSGAAVAASQELAAIIRADDALEIHLFVPPVAAGSLRVGQKVALRYDAFPFQLHGIGHGIVSGIATTASVMPEELTAGGGPRRVYRVRVRMEDEGQRFAIRPDMTLTGIIVLEERSLFDWLFAPLREKWRESRGSF